MASVRKLQNSFGAGEISPEMFGRIDDSSYRNGLELCRNYIPRPQGVLVNRPGLRFVREVADSSKRVRLIPFSINPAQVVVIELGPLYMRFHYNGGTLLDDGEPVQIVTPYAEADLFDIHYVQAEDVMTLVHPGYAPRELRRITDTNWQLSTIAFGSPLPAPAAPTLTNTYGDSGDTSPKYTYSYVVTALDADQSESSASPAASVGGNLFQTGSKVEIDWGAVTGGVRYNVYKLSGGLYGYIGQTTETSLIDDNIDPDLSKTPPLHDPVFNATGKYPGAVTYHDQRRCFGGTTSEPQKVWMTRPGAANNMSYSLPSRDDDRVQFRLSSREFNTIRHMVPLSSLVLLTSSSEWGVNGGGGPITPSSIMASPSSYIGASNVQPVTVNNAVLFVAERGSHLREMAYSYQSGGMVSGDLALRSGHLFEGVEITDIAYAKTPDPIVWMTMSDGRLLGLTYIPEQQVGAWHQHVTDGAFESVTVVPEGDEDVPYFVVRRTIDGETKRYIERMAPRRFIDQKDGIFLDSCISYSGVPATTFSGLDHLEGETVGILADGAVMPSVEVTDGQVTIPIASTKVHVGLPYVSDAKTLPAVAEIDGGYGLGRPKNVKKVVVRVLRTSGLKIGPSEEMLTEIKQRENEPMGTPAVLLSKEIPLMVFQQWQNSGQVYIRQEQPLPATIVSTSIEVEYGG